MVLLAENLSLDSKLKKAGLVLAFVVSSTLPQQVFAQAQVVDSQSLADKAAKQNANDQAKANAQLFYQLQLLQDEVMRMRGTLEEQAHEIRLIKQQRLDDYVQFDKRIAELQVSNAAAPIVSTSSEVESSSAVEASQDDASAYKAAFEWVRQKNLPEAVSAFNAFLKDFPQSSLLPNAYYWLGSVELQSKSYEAAAQAFGQLLNNYPDDKRVPDTMLKQAKALYLNGDKELAKANVESLITRFSHSNNEALQKVVRSGREFLNKYFP